MFCLVFAKETHHWILFQSILSTPPTQDPLPSLDQCNGALATVENSSIGTVIGEVELQVVSPPNANMDPNPESNLEVADHLDGLIIKPTLVMPWNILRFAVDSQLAPFLFHGSVTFMCMFISLVLLPLRLVEAPYNLSAGIVGVTFIPVGVTMMVFAAVGGMLSDVSGRVFNSAPEGSLVYGLRLSLLVIAGCIGFGLTLQAKVNLAGPLLTQCLIGAGQAAFMPALSGYLSTVRPHNAGGVASIMMFLMFVFAAIGVSFSIPITNAIGFQNFQFLLAGLSLITTLNAMFFSSRILSKQEIVSHERKEPIPQEDINI